MKAKKKRYFKKWLDYLLIGTNCMIVCIICSINDFTSIVAYLKLVLILGVIFAINTMLLKKYSKTLETLKEED